MAEVSIEATDHGFSTGDLVRFYDVVGAWQLNYAGLNTEFYITKVDDDNFLLDGTDGANFNAWDGSGTVKAVYEITTPWSATEVFDLHISPIADVVRVTHEDYLPRKLTRIRDNEWTIETIEPSTGPFLAANTTTTKTLETSKTSVSGYYTPAGTAAITLTAVGHTPFVAAHVGAYFLLNHTRDDNRAELSGMGTSDTVRTKGAFSLSTYGQYDGISPDPIVDLQRKVGDGDWASFRKFLVASAYAGDETEDDVDYRVIVTSTGVDFVGQSNIEFVAQDAIHRSIVKVTGFTSTTVVTVEAVTAIYFNDSESDNQTSDWAEGAWSAVKYYPRTITMHEDRAWYASTTTSPQTMWSSKTGEYDDFTKGVYDNEAIVLELNDSDVSQIEWIASFGKMFVGTSKKEYMVSANNVANPITPTDRKAVVQSAYGSSHIQPAILDNGILFAQRSERAVRFITLNEYGDRQVNSDLSRLVDHMLESAPIQFAIQTVPNTTAWIPRADGQAILFGFNPAEDFLGWSRCVTGSLNDYPTAKYKSFAVIPAPPSDEDLTWNSREDQVWYTVLRRINGTEVTYVEQFAPRITDELDEAIMLDASRGVASDYDKLDIIVASDTIRYGAGLYGSGPYGGMI